jgi:hypothetical protein
MYTPGLDFLRVFMGAIYAGKVIQRRARFKNFVYLCLTRVTFRRHCSHCHAAVTEQFCLLNGRRH